MVSRDEAIEILNAFKPKDEEDTKLALSFRLAHTSKFERQKHLRGDVESNERLICAVIEISRIWRGYHCR